ncbi:rhodanese-like domain-containing protein [Bosea psychrotolerans]|uniref:Rhodanese-like domain-containing protein n=1 Tax=Bosea psychrotolerans TaxID=1871628 RepID=A0A2S4M1J8_9HYPH|nr:rhodanese-like domain-containing protein [Bosea psychrotolerans]POR48583.1 rhodanese-like domain-containing protein [Bosea psychrotolerans]
MAAIDPLGAKRRLHAPGEIACLDVREHGQYGEGHPFLAVPCPYSRLEALVTALVPRRDVPIILVDEGDGVASRAAARLAALGYADIDWIDGGAPAWAAAGYTLFKGVNVPSKTLGELVEAQWHIPAMGPDALEAWRSAHRSFQLFDGRPAVEFAKMTIPGSRSMPNGEAGHRWDALALEAGPVVINCAGRTRSIIGAAGLAILQPGLPVLALENGTQGWALSGRALAYGRAAAPLPAAQAMASRQRADAFMAAHGLLQVDRAEAERLAREPDRTTYLLDVRDPAEHAAAPRAAAPSAPGGQLVQATDQWIGVRRARVILADDTGLRAALAAFWLRQLGYETYVLAGIDEWPTDWRLPAEPFGPLHPAALPEVAASEAASRARDGDLLLDLRGSLDYRAGHLPGAAWSMRPRLPAVAGRRLLLAGEANITALAAVDLIEAGAVSVHRIAGDAQAWRNAGLALETSPGAPVDAEAIDFLFFVHDRHDGNLDAARRYLAWEMGLLAQLDDAERGEYRLDAIDLRDLSDLKGEPSS